MELDVKDMEGVAMLPLDDGRVAYVDKNGRIFMYGLKEEEFLSAELEEVDVEQDACDPSKTIQEDPEFIFTNFLPDQCPSFVLETAKGNATMDIVEGYASQIEEIEETVDTDADINEAGEEIDPDYETNVDLLQVEDDCVEQVTMFKCRACTFTASEKDFIVQHFTQEHILGPSLNTELILPVANALPVSEEFERLAQSVTADTQEDEGERHLFLCGKCQAAFETIELCKQHMILEHKYISGKSKTIPKQQENDVTQLHESNANNATLNLALNNSTPEISSPLINVMDVGGIKVQWQPLSLEEVMVDPPQTLPAPPPATENENKSVNDSKKKDSAVSGKKAAASSKALDESSKLEVQKVRERERKIKCTFRACPYKFSSQKALQVHKSCHSKNLAVKEFHCVHCDEKFVRWRLCSVHLWRVHQVDVDLLPCPVCDTYKAATPMKLETHMRTHRDQRPYQCQSCPKTFKQSAQLCNHYASVHLDKKSGDSGPRWYMQKRCDLCGKTYADAKCLKKHVQAVHSKIKPYVCSVCGHSSACRAMLALHLRQHTGEKPHACTHCDYRSGDHNTLRRHMMRHTGERRYKCPHCPYAAIQSTSIKTHLRTRHPGESGMFSCSMCSFQTINEDAYVQHVADHQKGLIASKETNKKDASNDQCSEEVEYFPGNVAAAHLVYRYLGAFLQEPGRRLPAANVTDSRTSADGTMQSITIQIPSQEDSADCEDDESSHSFLLKGTDDDVGIDTGGITIPAEPTDLSLVES